MLFTGDNLVATSLLLTGVFGASAAILMMSHALRKEDIRIATYFVPSLIAVVTTMCVMRDILRDAYLKPYYHSERFPVRTQRSVFSLLLALFIAGVVLRFVMLKRYGLFPSTGAAEFAPKSGASAAK